MTSRHRALRMTSRHRAQRRRSAPRSAPYRDYRHAGIDLFLPTKHQGKGYGPEAIRLVCRLLFDERRHHRITIDPATDNLRAIAAYEKVGFKRVGVMRRYERAADGSYHDGMLMDLLPEDLLDGQ